MESDTTNDIDALMDFLNPSKVVRCVPVDWTRYHTALTALVAERDGLKQRVAELEAHPPADRDRELRKDLICAALTGILAHEGLDREFDCVIEEAMWCASKAISKMQEESEQ